MHTADIYVIVNMAHPCGETYVMDDRGDGAIAYGSIESAALAQAHMIMAIPSHTIETACICRCVPVSLDDVRPVAEAALAEVAPEYEE